MAEGLTNRRNVLKYKVLLYLSLDEGYHTPSAIARALHLAGGWDRIYKDLLKYYRYNLLWRKENPVRYRITPKGRARLQWLAEQERVRAVVRNDRLQVTLRREVPAYGQRS
jgi:predicted transcriptional regulator